MKRKTSALTLIMVLLFLAMVGTQVVIPVNANFGAAVKTSPPPGVKPPTISIVSPEDKVYAARELLLNFSAGSAAYSNPLSAMSSGRVYYKADWMQNETFVDYGTGWFSINLTDVPDGVHNVSVRVEQGCFYSNGSGQPYYFNIEGQSTVRFTIDNTVEARLQTVAVAVASMATVTVVGMGLLIYFKKRKR